jgi:hypothetical protein
VQRPVDRRRHAGRGADPAVVDEERPRVDGRLVRWLRPPARPDGGDAADVDGLVDGVDVLDLEIVLPGDDDDPYGLDAWGESA